MLVIDSQFLQDLAIDLEPFPYILADSDINDCSTLFKIIKRKVDRRALIKNG